MEREAPSKEEALLHCLQYSAKSEMLGEALKYKSECGDDTHNPIGYH